MSSRKEEEEEAEAEDQEGEVQNEQEQEGIHIVIQYFQVLKSSSSRQNDDDCSAEKKKQQQQQQNNNNNYLIRRQREYDECLYKNLINKYVLGVHVLLENENDENWLQRTIQRLQRWLDQSSTKAKLQTKILGRQMLYSDAFQYCNESLGGQIAVIMNSDIIIGPGVEKLLSRQYQQEDADLTNKSTGGYFHNTVLSLTRHENKICKFPSIEQRNEDDRPSLDEWCRCPFIPDWTKNKTYYSGSHDSFWFVPPLSKHFIKCVQHVQNRWGAEHLVIKELISHGYKVYNPSLSIITYHNHSSEIRPWRKDNDDGNIADKPISDPKQHLPIYPIKLFETYPWWPITTTSTAANNNNHKNSISEVPSSSSMRTTTTTSFSSSCNSSLSTKSSSKSPRQGRRRSRYRQQRPGNILPPSIASSSPSSNRKGYNEKHNRVQNQIAKQQDGSPPLLPPLSPSTGHPFPTSSSPKTHARHERIHKSRPDDFSSSSSSNNNKNNNTSLACSFSSLSSSSFLSNDKSKTETGEIKCSRRKNNRSCQSVDSNPSKVASGNNSCKPCSNNNCNSNGNGNSNSNSNLSSPSEANEGNESALMTIEGKASLLSSSTVCISHGASKNTNIESSIIGASSSSSSSSSSSFPASGGNNRQCTGDKIADNHNIGSVSSSSSSLSSKKSSSSLSSKKEGDSKRSSHSYTSSQQVKNNSRSVASPQPPPSSSSSEASHNSQSRSKTVDEPFSPISSKDFHLHPVSDKTIDFVPEIIDKKSPRLGEQYEKPPPTFIPTEDYTEERYTTSMDSIHSSVSPPSIGEDEHMASLPKNDDAPTVTKSSVVEVQRHRQQQPVILLEEPSVKTTNNGNKAYRQQSVHIMQEEGSDDNYTAGTTGARNIPKPFRRKGIRRFLPIFKYNKSRSKQPQQQQQQQQQHHEPECQSSPAETMQNDIGRSYEYHNHNHNHKHKRQSSDDNNINSGCIRQHQLLLPSHQVVQSTIHNIVIPEDSSCDLNHIEEDEKYIITSPPTTPMSTSRWMRKNSKCNTTTIKRLELSSSAEVSSVDEGGGSGGGCGNSSVDTYGYNSVDSYGYNRRKHF